MPSRAGEVLDVVGPIPSWQFTNSAVQPLHSWRDVYKRQEFKLVGLGDLREGDFFPDRCMSPRELGEESVMPTIVPVSYTHLDVYKRQG